MSLLELLKHLCGDAPVVLGSRDAADGQQDAH